MARNGSKRSFKKSSKRGSKKSFKKKHTTTKALDKRVKHIEKDLIELKWFDYAWAATITHTGVNLEGQWLITQGTAYNNRVGNKISPTSMQMKVSIVSDPDQNNAPVLVRMIAFWDRQVNGASPVLLNYNNGLLDPTTITNPVYAPRNYNTLERYTIVEDKVMILNPVNFKEYVTADGDSLVSQTQPIVKFISRRYPLSRVVKYDTNGGTMADLVSNAFYVCFICDTSNATIQPLMSGGIRLYYKDA